MIFPSLVFGGSYFLLIEINFGHVPDEHLEPSRTSMMELFAKTVNCWKLLSIIVKIFIIDVQLGSKYASWLVDISMETFNKGFPCSWIFSAFLSL